MKQINEYILEKLKIDKSAVDKAEKEDVNIKKCYDYLMDNYTSVNGGEIIFTSDEHEEFIKTDIFRTPNYRYNIEYQNAEKFNSVYGKVASIPKSTNYVMMATGIKEAKSFYDVLKNNFDIYDYGSPTKIFFRLIIFPKDKNKVVNNDFYIKLINFILDRPDSDFKEKLLKRNNDKS